MEIGISLRSCAAVVGRKCRCRDVMLPMSRYYRYCRYCYGGYRPKMVHRNVPDSARLSLWLMVWCRQGAARPLYSHDADSGVKFAPVGKHVVVFSSLGVKSTTEFAGSACICTYIRHKPQMVQHVARVDDVYFASGDLLRRDAFGFYFWVDRMGDTFRLVTTYCRPTS